MYRPTIIILSTLTLLSAYGKELHDPTLPIKLDTSQTFTTDPFTLKAIIISPDKKMILMGNRHLFIGDEIMGKKIIAIEQNAVKLQTNKGEIINLALFENILKNNNTESKP